ncbi:MAG: nucleotidyltransferase domain-containing protein [Candidatus Bathyarchaeota archaeon]|nr:nucleotidyltransferase domain-containing protein [Candidatus Bathyarchaeota archaeon]
MGQLGFIECIKERIERDDVTREGLHLLILFGSWVRGDFVDGVSDLDFFAVLRGGSHEKVIPRLSTILEECTEHVKCTEVDLPWEYLENLNDPLNKGYPFNFLTFYQEDFLENHVVVYGERIERILPRYDWRTLIGWRTDRLLKNLERDRRNPKMLRIGAGQVIRLLALMNGARSIRKDDVLKTMEALDDPEALEIFRAYLGGRELDRGEDFWVDFIRSRIEKIKSGV